MAKNFHGYRIKSNSLENIHGLTVRSSLVVSAELNPKMCGYHQTTVMHAHAHM